jgi:hypothetical protein
MEIFAAGSNLTGRSWTDDQLLRLSIELSAWDGEVGVGAAAIPDPSGNDDYPGAREFKITDSGVYILDGFIGDQTRTAVAPMHPEREHLYTIRDPNALVYGFRVNEQRPAENDVTRMTYFLNTYRPTWTQYIPSTNLVNLDAANYGGSNGFEDLIRDLVEQAGKTFFVHDLVAGGRCAHWHRTTEGHSAGIDISDDHTVVNGTTSFAPHQYPARTKSVVDLKNDIVGRDQAGRTFQASDQDSIDRYNADGLEHDARLDFETTSQADLQNRVQQYLTEHKDERETYEVKIGPLDFAAMAKWRVGDLIDVTSSVLGMPGTVSPIRIAHATITVSVDENGKPLPGFWDVAMELGSPIRSFRRRLRDLPVNPTPFIPGCADAADGYQTRLAALSGLVAYYPADDPDTQDDLADESGNNHDALMTTAGGAVLEQPPARSDTVFSVKATGSPVWEAADHADLDLVDGTLMLFIKRNTAADLTAGMILGKGSTSSFETCPYLIRYDETGGAGTYMVQLGNNVSTAAYVAITAAALGVSQWIAFTWDGSDVKAYTHDGTNVVLVDTDVQTITPFNSSASFKIGAVVGTSTPDVTMDEIAVLNRAATIDEFEGLFCTPKVPEFGQNTCEQFTGTGSQVNFTLNYAYLSGSVTATVDGVNTVVTEVSSTTGVVGFIGAPTSGANIVICYQIATSTGTGEANPQPTPSIPGAQAHLHAFGSNSMDVSGRSFAGSNSSNARSDHEHLGVRAITASSSNTMQQPIVNFRPGSNITFGLSDTDGNGALDTITINGGAGGGTISAGSNSSHVAEISAAGASSTLWSPFDHRHAGVSEITSSSSNTLQRGRVNLRPGTNIGFGLTDTDGDGEFDTLTITSSASGGGGAPAAGVTGTVLSPSSDTYINSTAATSNLDSSTTLILGEEWAGTTAARIALFTFDTSALAGKTIYSADLWLYRTSNNANNMTIGMILTARRILRAYVPTEVTYNVYSTGNNWTTAGAKGDGTDRALIKHGSAPLGASSVDVDQWHVLPLAMLVKESLDASETTLRFAVGLENLNTDQDAMSFASLEHATAALRPTLRIQHS